MLPENLREFPPAAAVDAFDGSAVTGGHAERGELTFEIAPERIAAVCEFLKRDQMFALYPELIESLMESIYRSDGRPKQRIARLGLDSAVVLLLYLLGMAGLVAIATS